MSARLTPPASPAALGRRRRPRPPRAPARRAAGPRAAPPRGPARERDRPGARRGAGHRRRGPQPARARVRRPRGDRGRRRVARRHARRGARGGRRRPARDACSRARPCRPGWVGKSLGLLAGRAARRAGSGCCSPTPTWSTPPTRSAARWRWPCAWAAAALTLFPTIDVRGRRRAHRDARGRWPRSGRSWRPGRSPARDGSRVAIAAGGYMLVERAPLRRASAATRRSATGWWTTCASRRAVKRAGAPAAAGARPAGWRGCACTTAPREVWDGWSKNASFAAVGGRRRRALVGRRRDRGRWRALPAAAAAAGAAAGDRRRLAATGWPALASMAALQRLTSWAVPDAARATPRRCRWGCSCSPARRRAGRSARLAGRGPEWRGRRYPLAR